MIFIFYNFIPVLRERQKIYFSYKKRIFLSLNCWGKLLVVSSVAQNSFSFFAILVVTDKEDWINLIYKIIKLDSSAPALSVTNLVLFPAVHKQEIQEIDRL